MTAKRVISCLKADSSKNKTKDVTLFVRYSVCSTMELTAMTTTTSGKITTPTTFTTTTTTPTTTTTTTTTTMLMI